MGVCAPRIGPTVAGLFARGNAGARALFAIVPFARLFRRFVVIGVRLVCGHLYGHRYMLVGMVIALVYYHPLYTRAHAYDACPHSDV